MSELHERMRVARKHLGMNQTEMAKYVGMSLRGYQANEQGQTSPSGMIVLSLAGLGINANWLVIGKGEMLLEDTPAEKYQALRKAAEEAFKYIDARTKGIALDVKDSLRIELYDTLSGQPEDTQESEPSGADPLEMQVNANKKNIDTLWECARSANIQIECLLKLHNRTRQSLIKRAWDWALGNNIKA